MQRHAAEPERTENRYPDPKEEPTHECSAGAARDGLLLLLVCDGKRNYSF